MKKFLLIVGSLLLIIGIIGMFFTQDQVKETKKKDISKTTTIVDSYHNVKLDIGQGLIKVVPSKNYETTLTVNHAKSNHDYYYEIKNDTLFVKTSINSDERKKNYKKGKHRSHDLEVILTIPNKKLKSFTSESFSGIVDIDKINAEHSSMNVHVGEINVNKLVSKDAIVKVGTGDITIKSLKSHEANVSINIGSIKLSSLNPNINIDGHIGMGKGIFEYKTAPQATHFDIKSNIGNVNLNKVTNAPQSQATSNVTLSVGTGGSASFNTK